MLGHLCRPSFFFQKSNKPQFLRTNKRWIQTNRNTRANRKYFACKKFLSLFIYPCVFVIHLTLCRKKSGLFLEKSITFFALSSNLRLRYEERKTGLNFALVKFSADTYIICICFCWAGRAKQYNIMSYPSGPLGPLGLLWTSAWLKSTFTFFPFRKRLKSCTLLCGWHKHFCVNFCQKK